MSLSSLQLDAFAAVAREKSFSEAANKLGITQSALSQRVLNLEDELGTTLVIRQTSGLRLTEQGEKLLRYCQTKEMLESDVLSGLKTKSTGSLAGFVRIAAFSSIAKSLVIPLLGPWVRTHPNVQIEMISAELRDIPGLLTSGSADFIFLNQASPLNGAENHLIGSEEYVLIGGTKKGSRQDVYLDHDMEDLTTFDFFKNQGQKNISLKRSYFNNIDVLIEAVKQGIGLAVVPVHLLKDIKGIEIRAKDNKSKSPIYFSYYRQSFYTPLQKEIIELFVKRGNFVAK